MVDKKIGDLTLKATPVSTDELELQETGDGDRKKATLAGVSAAVSTVHARGSCDSSGTLQSGDVGVASVSEWVTGRYSWSISSVGDTDTAQVFATTQTPGAECIATLNGTTTAVTVIVSIGGVWTSAAHSILVYDEG